MSLNEIMNMPYVHFVISMLDAPSFYANDRAKKVANSAEEELKIMQGIPLPKSK